jgi:hypothetical protein
MWGMSFTLQRQRNVRLEYFTLRRSKVTLKHFGILGVEVSSHALETFFTMLRE